MNCFSEILNDTDIIEKETDVIVFVSGQRQKVNPKNEACFHYWFSLSPAEFTLKSICKQKIQQ